MNCRKNTRSLISCCAFAAVFMFLFSPAALRADTVSSPETRKGIYKNIDDYLDRQLRNLHIPGAVLAVVNGSDIEHFYNFGTAGPGGNPPVLQTPFILGSLTKSVTAMAVMQLVEAGKIDLDNPVREYLPWFEVADADATARMTVRHLLNQTSGLSMLSGMMALANFDTSPDACEKRIRELSSFVPPRAPGVEFEYSDMNYNLLGLIIEAASGEAYGDYIEKHIFSPLGMVHSHVNQFDARKDGMAVGHTMRFGITKPELNLPRPVGSTPSGQLIASAGDMARYMTAMLQGGSIDGISVLSREGVAELVLPTVSAGSMGVDMGDYAMGWFIEDVEGGLRIWHDGMVPDFFSYMELLPEQNRGLILLVNANHMIVNYSLLDVCEALTDMLTDQPVETGSEGGVIWVLRCYLLILVLQILGIVFTIRRIRRWRNEADRRPKKSVLWVIHIILSPILHFLLVVSVVVLLFMDMVRFMLLFMPDLTGLLLVCGGISALWLVLRPWLILRAVKSPVRESAAAVRRS